MLVVSLGGPTMFARIGVIRALDRHVERVSIRNAKIVIGRAEACARPIARTRAIRRIFRFLAFAISLAASITRSSRSASAATNGAYSAAWQTLRKCYFDSFVIAAQTYVTFQTHDLRKAIPKVGTPRQRCAANGSTKCSQSESRILNAPNAVR